MKEFLKNNKNELIKVSLLSLCTILCLAALTYFLPTPVFCDLFSEAKEITESTQDKIVDLAIAICPLALIVVLVLMLTTHNDKKLSVYKSIAITILVVFFLILLVDKGLVTDFIQNLVDKTT